MVSIATSASKEVGNRDLVLRICGTARDGQIVRLRSGKCTIGSAPRCTLRLHARGVQPLHCLILRGGQATVVRRWAADTRLNGRGFGDAELVPGDRLTVGPIEFEVLDAAPPPAAEAQPAPATRDSQPPASVPDHREIDRLRDRLTAVGRQGRERARGLIEQLRTARRQIAQRQDQHDRVRAELEADRQALEDERRQWNAERDRAHVESAGTGEQLAADAAELETERKDFERQQQRWEDERADAHERLQEQADELDARRTELEARQASLDARREDFRRERDEWEAERSATEARLRARAEQLDAHQAELDARPSAFDSQGERQESPRASEERGQEEEISRTDQPGEIRFQDPSADSPVSSEDLLRRLGTFGDDEAEDEELDHLPVEPLLPEPTSETVISSPDPADDESIDEYMSRLLARVRTVTREPDQPPPPVDRTPDEGSPPWARTASAGSPQKPAAARPAGPKRGGPLKMSPRAKAPEKVADLSAMRELANLSAHTAIESHSRRVLTRAVSGKVPVVIVALLAGGGLLWLWWSKGSGHLVLCSALVGFVVALFWAMQYMRLLGRMSAGESGHPVAAATRADDGNPELVDQAPDPQAADEGD